MWGGSLEDESDPTGVSALILFMSNLLCQSDLKTLGEVIPSNVRGILKEGGGSRGISQLRWERSDQVFLGYARDDVPLIGFGDHVFILTITLETALQPIAFLPIAF